MDTGYVRRSRISRLAEEERRPLMRERRNTAIALLGGALLGSICATAMAQRSGPAAASPRASAPIDLTGYWVAVVSEDWRHRMATPRKGDYESVPLNAEGRRVAGTWNLDADNAAGQQCRAFGIGGILRQPGRLHITWADDDTLKVEFDAGTQTRLLEFHPTVGQSGEQTWQGRSSARWLRPPGAGGAPVRAQIGNDAGPVLAGGGGRGQRGGPPLSASLNEGGSLEVMTTGFRAGYLRKNGVPYSEAANITEYFHRLPVAPNGDVWLHVVTIVDDPQYLTQPFYTSTMFKREQNGAKWHATECRTPPPPE
jgi:hypothetical protein